MIINGGPGPDTLTGTGADDIIDGKEGSDTMIGLAGNDIYYVDNAGDQVIEAAGGGTDNVYARAYFALIGSGLPLGARHWSGASCLPDRVCPVRL
jgi:Ca2+-binding RTX toxin-like protein